MKKVLLIVCVLMTASYHSFSQGIGIGTTSPDASAVLDVTHNSKGILIPRMSSTAMNSIVAPAKGLMIYDSLTNRIMINTGTPAAPNWQEVGSYGTEWILTGNNGIDPANQFMGTTDNQPLRFRTNNIQVGELHPTTGNIFWGLRAGQSGAAGSHNIAIGRDALRSNGGTSELVAIGDSALFANTIGPLNTAIGVGTLSANTAGGSNTATGWGSLHTNTTGNFNTGIGAFALQTSTIGDNNTATGFSALSLNSSGAGNTA